MPKEFSREWWEEKLLKEKNNRWEDDFFDSIYLGKHSIKNESQNNFLGLIYDEMEVKGLGQKAIASSMSTTQQYVSKLLRGECSFKMETADRLAKAVGMKLKIRLIEDA